METISSGGFQRRPVLEELNENVSMAGFMRLAPACQCAAGELRQGGDEGRVIGDLVLELGNAIGPTEVGDLEGVRPLGLSEAQVGAASPNVDRGD